MADNFECNAGTGGKTFASDEISLVDYPRMKLVHGADGTNDGDVATGNPLPVRLYVGTTIVTVGAGAVGSGTPRVTLASDDPAVALLTTIDTDTGNIATNTNGAATSLAVIDDWDESDRAKVNLVVGQAGVTAGAGAVAANTPRVTLASDDPAVALLGTIDADTSGMLTSLQTLDNIVSGNEAQVDVVAALPAGDNNIGNVDLASAIPAGTNLIGRVQVDAQTANGCSPIKILDSDETEDEVKATAGQIYSLYCFNSTNAILYVKLYNATAANVTVGTTTPVMTIPVPGNNDTDGAGVVLNFPTGLAFSTAITIATTTGLADADTGAPGANAMTIAGSYK